MSEEKDDDEKIEQSSDPWSSFEAEEREDSPKENLDFLDALSEELADSAVPDGVDGFAGLSPSDASHLMSSESQVDDDAPSAQIEQGGGTGSETTHDSDDDDVADWLSEQAVDGFDTGAENDTVEGSEETGEAVGHSNGQTDVEATETVGETSEHDADREEIVSSFEDQEHGSEGSEKTGNSESDTTIPSEDVDEAEAIAGWLDASANDSAADEQSLDVDLADGEGGVSFGEDSSQVGNGSSAHTLENLHLDSGDSESVNVSEVMNDFDVVSDGSGDTVSTVSLSEADVAAALGKGTTKKKSKVGVLGPVLGGVLSIPVVFLILLGVLWGTGRDPIRMRSWLPSILLPGTSGERKVASEEGPSLDDVSSEGSGSSEKELPETSLEESSSKEQASDETVGDGEPLAEGPLSESAGDSLAAEEPPGESMLSGKDSLESPGSDGVLPAFTVEPDSLAMINESPPIALDDPLLAVPPEMPSLTVPSPVEVAVANPTIPMPAQEIVSPQVTSRPELPALDYSSLDDAVESSLLSMAQARETLDGDEADHRRALVLWYKDLARVGEEFAMLESQASDSGRTVSEIPDSITTLYESLGAAGLLDASLKRLCRNWVDYSKRPDEGVLLIGMLESSREVGPFWNSRLSLEMFDGSMREVLVISRHEPRATIGERVAVAGIVFSENSVWAADCGPLHTSVESEAPDPDADKKPTVQSEDPFGENPF